MYKYMYIMHRPSSSLILSERDHYGELPYLSLLFYFHFALFCV